MSILLRHADIPKYGHRIAILSDGHAYYEDFINPYVDLGEVVPVPPHGDLIDRDVAYDKIAEQEGGNYVDMDLVGMGLNETPVIIPAEEEE